MHTHGILGYEVVVWQFLLCQRSCCIRFSFRFCCVQWTRSKSFHLHAMRDTSSRRMHAIKSKCNEPGTFRKIYFDSTCLQYFERSLQLVSIHQMRSSFKEKGADHNSLIKVIPLGQHLDTLSLHTSQQICSHNKIISVGPNRFQNKKSFTKHLNPPSLGNKVAAYCNILWFVISALIF